MYRIFLFLSVMFFINGIPHFVNGISGREFVEPFLYRFLHCLPNQVFNALWGLVSFSLAFLFYRLFRKAAGTVPIIGPNADTIVIVIAVVFTSVGLALFFSKGGWKQ